MQPFSEELMVQVEVEVGELGSGPGIVAAAMPIDELLILTGMREGLGAEKEHVLQKVGHPLTCEWIIEVADLHGEGCRRFFSLMILDQQDAQLIGQGQITVGAMIMWTGLQMRHVMTHGGLNLLIF